MNQNESTSRISSPTPIDAIPTNVPTEFLVQILQEFPETSSDDISIARIVVVGVGPLGSRMVRLLTRTTTVVSCYELLFDPDHEDDTSMGALFSRVRTCDLLFLLSAFDDEECTRPMMALGETARTAGALTIGITTDQEKGNALRSALPGNSLSWADTLFTVADDSFTGRLTGQSPAMDHSFALAGYAMRHMVTTIVNILVTAHFICVDFADITSVMTNGPYGRMGVAVASGSERGKMAATLALAQLERQGVQLEKISTLVATLHGSSHLTNDDFDQIARTLHEALPEDANFILTDDLNELMGENIKVTLMAVMRDMLPITEIERRSIESAETGRINERAGGVRPSR